MSSRHRSAWRRRFSSSRKTQVAVSVSVAVVAVVAAVAAVSFADQHESINTAALGSCLSAGTASASAAAPGASPAAAPSPCPSGSAAAPAVAAAAAPRVKVAPNDFATGPIAARQLGDVATRPVDGAGDAINLRQTAAEAADSGNCTIVVPRNPLTAQGLATPYQDRKSVV